MIGRCFKNHVPLILRGPLPQLDSSEDVSSSSSSSSSNSSSSSISVITAIFCVYCGQPVSGTVHYMGSI